jgi:hypothetical protein
MSSRTFSGPSLAVAATLAGGLAALLAATGLAALARPADSAARQAALEVKLDRLQRLERAPVGGLVYPKGAVCRDGAMRGAAVVEQKLRAGLGQAKLMRLSLEPEPATLDAAPTAVVLRFETEGSYEDATALMSLLDTVRPVIFVDTVDLETRTSAVSLQFSGRFYCSTSARL